MITLLSTEYPYWLIMAGVALLIFGCVGLSLRRQGAGAEPPGDENNEGHDEPDAELNKVELYNRLAKERRRTRWAETAAEDEPIKAEAQIQSRTPQADC